jgi:hypothetical protein
MEEIIYMKVSTKIFLIVQTKSEYFMPKFLYVDSFHDCLSVYLQKLCNFSLQSTNKTFISFMLTDPKNETPRHLS